MEIIESDGAPHLTNMTLKLLQVLGDELGDPVPVITSLALLTPESPDPVIAYATLAGDLYDQAFLLAGLANGLTKHALGLLPGANRETVTALADVASGRMGVVDGVKRAKKARLRIATP